jgi:WD40 repeat protein
MGSNDNVATLWDTRTGQKFRSFVGHSAGVRSVSFSSDGKYLFTGSDDGTTRIWDTRNGKELAKLYSLDQGRDWLVLTPDGHFDSSPNAEKLLTYRAAGSLQFELPERYREQFRRPGLLVEIMKVEK